MKKLLILKSWEDRPLLDSDLIDVTTDCNGDSYYDD